MFLLKSTEQKADHSGFISLGDKYDIVDLKPVLYVWSHFFSFYLKSILGKQKKKCQFIWNDLYWMGEKSLNYLL